VSTVSHELRTPLTSITGSLGLINGGTLGAVPDAIKDMLAIAEGNSRRLRQIDDLLDMDKLIAGKMSFDQPIKLDELLESATPAIRASLSILAFAYCIPIAQTCRCWLTLSVCNRC
jgi:signal transduction histidine kinase